jgi:membrane associated rhomboid family serine protease
MSITLILIIITVITSIAAWSNPERLSKWVMNPYMVSRKKEYYRFISSGFIHNDYVHLIFNMITLYFFGDAIEQVFGYFFGITGLVYFLSLYFLGMIVADIPSFIKYRNYAGYNSLGASGAVSAVVFSSILFRPTSMIYVYFAIGIPGFIFGILYLLYSYYQGKRMADNVNHDAHLYGALFGIVFSIAVYPSVIGNFIQQILDYRLF